MLTRRASERFPTPHLENSHPKPFVLTNENKEQMLCVDVLFTSPAICNKCAVLSADIGGVCVIFSNANFAVMDMIYFPIEYIA